MGTRYRPWISQNAPLESPHARSASLPHGELTTPSHSVRSVRAGTGSASTACASRRAGTSGVPVVNTAAAAMVEAAIPFWVRYCRNPAYWVHTRAATASAGAVGPSTRCRSASIVGTSPVRDRMAVVTNTA